MKIGRPPKNRISGSGDKLFHALKLWGLSWGTRADSPNHILNNNRWLQFELPRSTKTLMQDIKHGIPKDRLLMYFHFFDVDADLFINGQILFNSKKFEETILHSGSKIGSNRFHLSGHDNLLNIELYKQNNSETLLKLFELISGVYVAYLKDISLDEILKLILHIYKCEECHICVQMKAIVRGIGECPENCVNAPG